MDTHGAQKGPMGDWGAEFRFTIYFHLPNGPTKRANGGLGAKFGFTVCFQIQGSSEPGWPVIEYSSGCHLDLASSRFLVGCEICF